MDGTCLKTILKVAPIKMDVVHGCTWRAKGMIFEHIYIQWPPIEIIRAESITTVGSRVVAVRLYLE